MEKIRLAGEWTHAKPHKVLDKAGAEFAMVSAVEAKGIVGSDHRHYVLDLVRATPRDANYRQEEFVYAVLRRELITQYVRQKVLDDIFPLPEEKDEKGELVLKKESKRERAERLFRGVFQQPQDKDVSDFSSRYFEALKRVAFNNDVFVPKPFAALPEEGREQDERDVEAIAKYLVETSIPNLVSSFFTLETSALGGEDLVCQLHCHGINLRYLGAIAEAADKKSLAHLVFLSRLEIISRSARHFLDVSLSDLAPLPGLHVGKHSEPPYFGAVLVRFLNGMLGSGALGVNSSEEDMQAAFLMSQQLKEERRMSAKQRRLVLKERASRRPRVNGARLSDDLLAPLNLWQSIRASSAHKYRHELPASFALKKAQKLTLMRSLLRRCGVTVVSREYDFTLAEPLTIEDVLELSPVMKRLELVAADTALALQHAETVFLQGVLPLAYQLANESLQQHAHVYGPVHERTAEVHAFLAMICHQLNDATAAAEYQQKAAIIYELCVGLDDARTARAHMNLALYLRSVGHLEASIVHCQRAIYLMNLLSGGIHPELAGAYLNLSQLYQALGRPMEALKLVERAVQINHEALGETHYQTALRSALNSSFILYFRWGLVFWFFWWDGVDDNYQ